MKKHRDALPILAGMIVSSIFGLSFSFTAQALDEVAPMQLLGYRFALAALALTILQVTGVIRVNFRGKSVGTLLLLAVFQPGIYFVFETLGVKMTSASESGMIIATIPVVVTFFSMVFLRERPSIWQVGSVFLSVSGVFFIVWMTGTSASAGSLAGIASLFGAVLAAGVFNILSRKLSCSFKPVEITFVMMWFGAILFNAIALIQHWAQGNLGDYFTPLASRSVVIAIVYLGVLSSIGAFFLLNYMLSRMEASRSAVFSNLTTIVAIIAGVILRGDVFYWYHGLGGVLILLGVYGTNYFHARTQKEMPSTHAA